FIVLERLELQAELAVIDEIVAAGVHANGVGAHNYNVLRHDADIDRAAPDIFEAVQRKARCGFAEADDVALESTVRVGAACAAASAGPGATRAARASSGRASRARACSPRTCAACSSAARACSARTCAACSSAAG